MTATLDPTTRHDVLVARLAHLRTERDQAQVEVTPQLCGDDADRATNVDGHARLALLEDRIAAVELELAVGARPKEPAATGVVEVGDLVTVDFGDGPEDYLLASVEQAGAGLDVITPGSPLGRALLGAKCGRDGRVSRVAPVAHGDRRGRRRLNLAVVSSAGCRGTSLKPQFIAQPC